MIDKDGDGKADKKFSTTKSNETNEIIKQSIEYLKDNSNELPAVNQNCRGMWENFTKIFVR